MDDLSHWDFAERFSGYDAAALILGLEPRESEGEQHRVNVVADRMKLHYEYAFETLVMQFQDNEIEGFGSVDKVKRSGIELRSVIMSHLDAQAFFDDADAPLRDWIFSKRQTQFENQEFDRYEIAQWLSAIGMKSVYQFDRTHNSTTPTTTVQPIADRPLAPRERDTLLKLVIGMAIKGYTHNPAASKSTAPKEIADDLAALGMTITDDTVRKYLKQAADTVLPVKQRQQ